MIARGPLAILIALFAAGCSATVEGGFHYEYDGKVYRADGATPVKGVPVRIARPDAPEMPDIPEKYIRSAPKYVDKSQKGKTDHTGKYVGTLETVKGWKYTEFMGMHSSGPTRPPEPPTLDEVIVYVYEKGRPAMGYRLKVPPESQKEAISGIRKLHLPDLLVPDKPATQPDTAAPPQEP